ncbi:MAG TPA: preprotein translocase subunit YajC [Pyrinomonadaceae bacterium]|nr:preprotein translocase subunit YajC [Pyrinomonadaceae bacterium]
MTTITALILLQSPAGGTGGITGLLGGLMPFILIFGVFYFLIIVPQRRKQRALQETISQLKAGDRIVTTGGILATVTSVRDASLLVRSADKSILEISRSAVAGLQADEQQQLGS